MLATSRASSAPCRQLLPREEARGGEALRPRDTVGALFFRLAVNVELGVGDGPQSRRMEGPTAVLADAVGPIVHPGQRFFHLGEQGLHAGLDGTYGICENCGR